MISTGASSWVDAIEQISSLSRERVRERHDLAEAARFGAFSLLLESVGRLNGSMEGRIGAATQLAQMFQERNKALIKEPISEEDLVYFAKIILENNWDWEDLCIAYLDPEAARIERLRENLRRTPTERWRRFEKFMSGLEHVKRA